MLEHFSFCAITEYLSFDLESKWDLSELKNSYSEEKLEYIKAN